MNIGDFKAHEKSKEQRNETSNFITNFIKDLTSSLAKNNKKSNNQKEIEEFKNKVEVIRQKIKEKNNSQELVENKIYVINDINDEKIGVVDVEEGYEFSVYISTDNETLRKLNEQGIKNKIYEMEKQEFENLELGNNICMENGKCIIYEGEIQIKNADAYDILQNLYFNLEQEKGTKNK